MQDLATAFALAFKLILSLDSDLLEIVLLSMRVSLMATLLACLIGMPLGALLAISRFRGRGLLITVVNAMMGLPPVVVGLLVYIHLSRSGPLGFLGLLYTPTAMIIAQCILITPIVAALSRQILSDLHVEYRELLDSLNIHGWRRLGTLISDGRAGLTTVSLAGFGRAIAEVGAVMIVGGNIDHLTRVMTTAIALETSRGDLSLALALGLILVLLAICINLLASFIQLTSRKHADD